MSRRSTAIGLLLTTWASGCSSEVQTTASCEPEHRRFDGVCQPTCVVHADCSSGERCDPLGVCLAAGAGPVILGVDSDGPLVPDGSAHYLGAALVVTGERLAFVEVSLAGLHAGLQAYPALSVQPGATDTTLVVDLPLNVQEGEYVLTVANAAGADQTGVHLLRGAPGLPGPIGTCDPVACTSQILPGAALVSTMTLRAGNSGGMVSMRFNGTERIAAPPMTAGFWLEVVSRTTHAFSADGAHNRFYAAADLSALVPTLSALAAAPASDQLAMLVSIGDVSALMHQDVGGARVAGELVALGAGHAVHTVGSTDAFAFVGYFGLGVGNGSLVLSRSGQAEATVILADRTLIGSSTQRGDQLPVGTILMYDGTGIVDGAARVEDIGQRVGDAIHLPGWKVCNGNGGTPNLLDRFVRADVSAGAVGGTDSAVHNHDSGTLSVSNHQHTGGSLAAASHQHAAGSLQSASHTHSAGTLRGNHSHSAGSLHAQAYISSGDNVHARVTAGNPTWVPTACGNGTACAPVASTANAIDVAGAVASTNTVITGTSGGPSSVAVSGSSASTSPSITGSTGQSGASVSGSVANSVALDNRPAYYSVVFVVKVR